MSSNQKNLSAPGGSREPAAPSGESAGRRSPLKAALTLACIGLLPFAVWLIGSGIVSVTPPVYRSGAMVRIEPGKGLSLPEACDLLRSEEIAEAAARELAGKKSGDSLDPMSGYLLWSSLSVGGMEGSALVKVEARARNPEEAKRMAVAVVEAYEAKIHGSSPSDARPLIYLTPMEAEPTRVSDETRMMLGIAGFASLGLLLCIPLLRLSEGAMPLRLGLPGLHAGGPGEPRTV